jgi:hypothetical protein
VADPSPWLANGCTPPARYARTTQAKTSTAGVAGSVRSCSGCGPATAALLRRAGVPAGHGGGAAFGRYSTAGRREHRWPVGYGGTAQCRNEGNGLGKVPRMASAGPAGAWAVEMIVGRRCRRPV